MYFLLEKVDFHCQVSLLQGRVRDLNCITSENSFQFSRGLEHKSPTPKCPSCSKPSIPERVASTLTWHPLQNMADGVCLCSMFFLRGQLGHVPSRETHHIPPKEKKKSIDSKVPAGWDTSPGGELESGEWLSTQPLPKYSWC